MKLNDKMLYAMGSLVFITSLPSFALPPLGGFLPGPAQPSQVSRSLTNQAPKARQVVPSEQIEPAPTQSAIPEATKKIKFQLNGVVLVGNHVFPTSTLEVFYKDKIHKTISVADIFVILQNITNFYRNHGYILTRAILPEQKVTDGIVKLQVIEGYIGNIHVSGQPHGATQQVILFGNKIKENRPLQIKVMEKYLFLANEIPNTQVKAVLEASHDKTPALGSSDLSLVTINRPISGYMSYDNYGTRYIGPQQMTANIAGSSFLKSGDLGQVTMTKTPKGGELTFIDANYNLPTGATGSRLLLGATRTQTHPLYVLRPLQINGLNSNYYTMATFPVIRTRTTSLNWRVGFNYLDSPTTTINNLTLFVDHLRSLDVGFLYNGSDRWYGLNQVNADFRQGLPLFGYSSNFNPNTALTSRPGGRGTYSKVAVYASRLQALYGPISLNILAQGQYGFNPLLSPEQFPFGGSQIGRGYDPAEILGDKGAAGSLELRYDKGLSNPMINSLQFYTFYDAGRTWNYLLVGGVPKKQSATSTGIGLRFTMTKYLSGNLMWTQTLTKPVNAEDLIGRGTLPRTWFSVVAIF